MKGTNGQAFAPDKVEVSFIYDFMDQAKTACPRFKRYGCPKNAEGGNQRIFRIMGVKVRRVAAVERTRGPSPRVLHPPRVSRSASSSSSLPPRTVLHYVRDTSVVRCMATATFCTTWMRLFLAARTSSRRS